MPYKVVFSGALALGQDPEKIRAQLVQRFKVPSDRVDQFFSGGAFVVKVCPDEKTAERYREALSQAGLVCKVVAMRARPQPSSPTMPVQAAGSQREREPLEPNRVPSVPGIVDSRDEQEAGVRPILDKKPAISEPAHSDQIAALENRISQLTAKLAEAKQAVQSWVDANASLSQSAAEARAKNQGAGRGFLGGFLGSKFRGAMRASAAASNAAIAKEVADKRGRIAEGKREAQQAVRHIQEALAATKTELKALKTATKTKARNGTLAAKSASASLDLLQKLKEARDAGLLTEEEFVQKRKKLIADL